MNSMPKSSIDIMSKVFFLAAVGSASLTCVGGTIGIKSMRDCFLQIFMVLSVIGCCKLQNYFQSLQGRVTKLEKENQALQKSQECLIKAVTLLSASLKDGTLKTQLTNNKDNDDEKHNNAPEGDDNNLTSAGQQFAVVTEPSTENSDNSNTGLP